MSIKPFDSALVLRPCGLQNSGVICYFNTMLQCFLSQTSVIQTFDLYPELRTRNELCSAVWQLIKWSRQGLTDKVRNTSVSIWTALQRQLRVMKITPFGTGMEDTHEGFTKFLEAFDAPELEELFESRRKIIVTCTKCNESHVLTNDKGKPNQDIQACIGFSLDDFQKGDGLKNMLLEMNGETDNNYKCTQCGECCVHKKTEKFIFTPEVIVILFKKYEWTAMGAVKQNWAADAPKTFSIPGVSKDLNYRMTAMSEHSGSSSGGHYWAHALRTDGAKLGMYRLNDGTVTGPLEVNSTMSTYMVWYHHYDEETDIVSELSNLQIGN